MRAGLARIAWWSGLSAMLLGLAGVVSSSTRIEAEEDAAATPISLERVAVVEFSTNDRTDEQAPGIGRLARDTAADALVAFAPVVPRHDVDLAIVAAKLTRGRDGPKRAFGRGLVARDLALRTGASHLVAGQVNATAGKFIVEVRVASAAGTSYLRKQRGSCKDVAEVPALVRDLVAQLEIEKPTDRDAARDPWSARARHDGPIYELRGGDDTARGALVAGLDWLVRHQADDGRWSADDFSARCSGEATCSGVGESLYDVGVTSLALLALMADGNTPTEGPHAESVAKALTYLRAQQGANGAFVKQLSPHSNYCHMAAAWALAEAYGMTRDEELRPIVERAGAYTLALRNPKAAWRYGPRPEDSDTSVTAWAIASLRAAELAGVSVADEPFDAALQWIIEMTDPDTGRVGYQRAGGPPARVSELMEVYPAVHSEALTAAGISIRLFAGSDPGTGFLVGRGRELLLACPPKWAKNDPQTVDFYYWFWGSLAMCEVGGKDWLEWSEAMEKALVGGQLAEGDACHRGSWPTTSPWAADGGRVYTTAMACLSLAAAQRFDVDLGRKPAR